MVVGNMQFSAHATWPTMKQISGLGCEEHLLISLLPKAKSKRLGDESPLTSTKFWMPDAHAPRSPCVPPYKAVLSLKLCVFSSFFTLFVSILKRIREQCETEVPRSSTHLTVRSKKGAIGYLSTSPFSLSNLFHRTPFAQLEGTPQGNLAMD